MRLLIVFTETLLVCLFAGCCRPWQEPQPVRPEAVRGWNSYKTGTLKIIGEFVLKEGESTESDNLGVQIVKISPLVTCLGQLQEPPQKHVTLRLYKPADKSTLIETTIYEGSGTLPKQNGTQLPSVSASINTKDRWVFVTLGETAP